MKKIVFATNNSNKLKEVKKALPHIQILSLRDIECFDELPEERDTLEGNAQQKAEYIYDKFKVPCFSDDTGLLIRALNNEPGVYSARYAGLDCIADDNIDKVLSELKMVKNRSAKFITVIALIINGEEFIFEGICKGIITKERIGNDGFGYDPIFLPDASNHTFAQMDNIEKGKISHRGLAVMKLLSFLSKKK